jgi:CCR4-NOT transcription complex subunit 3
VASEGTPLFSGKHGTYISLIIDLPHRTNKKHDEESVTSSKREESPVMKKAPVMLNLRSMFSLRSFLSPVLTHYCTVTEPHVPAEGKILKIIKVKQTLTTPLPPVVKPPPNPNFAQQPMASIVKAGLQPQPRPPPLPPIRYAAAAAANVSTPTTQGTPSHASSQAQPAPALTPVSSVPNPPPSTAQALSPSGIGIGQQTGQSSAAIPPQSTSQGSAVSSPSLTHPSVTSPMLSSASVSHQPDGSFYSGQESPALSDAVPSSSGGPAAASEPRKGTSVCEYCLYGD